MDPKVRLKKFVKMLEGIKGRHTELVTIYVPAGYDINAIKNQVFQERSTAQNIKSKATRKNVIAALDKILQELKFYKKTPEHGMAIFCGNTSGKEGEQNIEIWVIEPPEPLRVKMYRCDQQFLLDPLKEMLEEKRKYGLVVIDNKNATIGLLKGKLITPLKDMDSIVPGKIRAGGQSSVRFERVRENLARDWYKSVAEDVRNLLRDVDGILIGGPGPTKENFIEYLPEEVKKKIVAVKDIGYTGEYGLRELVNKSLEVLEKEEIVKEKKVLDEFFSRIRKGKLVTYGREEVKRALEMGAVEKLLLSEEVEDEEMEELAKRSKAEVLYISKDTMEGEQFLNMGGYGALLRFEIE